MRDIFICNHIIMIISLNGNIGSGKSTLMKKLKEKLSPDFFVFVDEPVDIWMNIKDDKGVDLLTNFYKDQEAYAFKFQMAAYISIVDLLKKAVRDNPGKIIITERCMHTARNVFSLMLRDTGKLSTIEYNIYDMWYDAFLEEMRDMAFIYIKTDAKLCKERVEKRSRAGEERISLEYLEMCGKYHDDWFSHSGKEQIVFNGNCDFENDESIVNMWINKIIQHYQRAEEHQEKTPLQQDHLQVSEHSLLVDEL
jgi:deoxyadenosine/deoxycytidine kinase